MLQCFVESFYWNSISKFNLNSIVYRSIPSSSYMYTEQLYSFRKYNTWKWYGVIESYGKKTCIKSSVPLPSLPHFAGHCVTVMQFAPGSYLGTLSQHFGHGTLAHEKMPERSPNTPIAIQSHIFVVRHPSGAGCNFYTFITDTARMSCDTSTDCKLSITRLRKRCIGKWKSRTVVAKLFYNMHEKFGK